MRILLCPHIYSTVSSPSTHGLFLQCFLVPISTFNESGPLLSMEDQEALGLHLCSDHEKGLRGLKRHEGELLLTELLFCGALSL